MCVCVCVHARACVCACMLVCVRACSCVHTLICSVISDSVTSWTTAHQAPLSMGFPRQEYWSGLPLPSPGDLSNPGLLHWQEASLPVSHQRSPIHLVQLSSVQSLSHVQFFATPWTAACQASLFITNSRNLLTLMS